MNTFDERKKSFEKKFVNDQELQFKVNAKKNKYLGEWAAKLMKKEEKMLVAELTIYYSQNVSYKNTSELNAHIYSDKRIKDYFQRYGKTLKERNRSKIRYESFRSFRNDLRTKVVTERELAKHL